MSLAPHDRRQRLDTNAGSAGSAPETIRRWPSAPRRRPILLTVLAVAYLVWMLILAAIAATVIVGN